MTRERTSYKGQPSRLAPVIFREDTVPEQVLREFAHQIRLFVRLAGGFVDNSGVELFGDTSLGISSLLRLPSS